MVGTYLTCLNDNPIGTGDEVAARLNLAALRAVTAADVQRVARKYIQPDRVVVVVVGDRKVIEPGIRALNLGEIKTLGIDDVFGAAPVVK